MSTTAALWVAAAASVAGTGAGIYQAEEQRKAEEEAQKKAEAARDAAEREKIRIARETRPEQQAAEGIKFGVDTEKSSFTDFLIEKPIAQKNSGLKTTGLSGLGYV